MRSLFPEVRRRLPPFLRCCPIATYRSISRFSGGRIAALSPHTPGRPADAGALLQAVRRAGRTILSEYESKQVCALHQIPCVETCLAHNEDEAVDAAVQLGFPVTIKLHSHTLLHHGQGPAIARIDVRQAAGVRQAWQEIRQQVIDRHGRQHFLGVTVQPTLAGDGREFFVHAESQSNSGPLLRHGVSLPSGAAANAGSPCELPPDDARRFEPLLEHSRHLLTANPGIREMNLQPLILAGDQLLGLGAQIVLQSS